MGASGLRDALVVLADSGEVPPAVRTEIGESWARSLDNGFHPDRFDVPFVCDPDPESVPMRTAGAVLQAAARELVKPGDARTVRVANSGPP